MGSFANAVREDLAGIVCAAIAAVTLGAIVYSFIVR